MGQVPTPTASWDMEKVPPAPIRGYHWFQWTRKRSWGGRGRQRQELILTVCQEYPVLGLPGSWIFSRS